MTDVNEVRRLKSSLEAATGSEKIQEILVILKKDVKPTEKLLRETKIGIAVNKLRTHSDKKISDLVKEIIKHWKDEVSAQKGKVPHAKATHTNKPAEAAAITPSNGTNTTSTTTEKSMSERFSNHGKPRNAKNDGVRTEIYSDKVRNSCIDLCYTAMALDSKASPADILGCAKSIELVVFENNKGNTTAPTYRNKMRSLYMNLKDKSNPMLRKRVVSGEVSPERLASMTPQEMASEELKEEIDRLDKQNLFKAQGATEKRAVTDRFTCGKCKQKMVSYYQMQTRSADEPLTTFCTCENCGNRWKFS